MHDALIISAIDTSPMNRGLSGADWLANPDNFAVVEGKDVALFDGEADGVYQFHMLYESRGKAAIAFTRKAFAEAFERGAQLIYGQTPVVMRHAILMARWVGGKFDRIVKTEYGDCAVHYLSKDMWRAQ